MECVRIVVDPAEFDRIIQQSRELGTQDHGDLAIYVKERATINGQPAVAITFTVRFGGRDTPVQTVTTANQIAAIAAVVRGVVERTAPGEGKGWGIGDRRFDHVNAERIDLLLKTLSVQLNREKEIRLAWCKGYCEGYLDRKKEFEPHDAARAAGEGEQG